MASKFLMRYPEKEDFNQYWFSEHTISALVSEISHIFQNNSISIACISTPSLYYSLPEPIRKSSKLFDIDQSFSRDPGFVLFDFNCPQNIPPNLAGQFDLLIIDPPFITRQVWEKYTEAIRVLSREQSKIILSSINENSGMLHELLQVIPCRFKPSIPHLVYQYNFFTNFETSFLSQENPEVPEN